jgi:hypothetical protein
MVLARDTGGLTSAPVHSLRRPPVTSRVAGEILSVGLLTIDKA